MCIFLMYLRKPPFYKIDYLALYALISQTNTPVNDKALSRFTWFRFARFYVKRIYRVIRVMYVCCKLEDDHQCTICPKDHYVS